jgi:hypothetical protein
MGMSHDANRPYRHVAGETLIEGGGLAGGLTMLSVVSGIVGLAWGVTSVGLVADAVAGLSAYGTTRLLRS